jgi:hypothetical protein
MSSSSLDEFVVLFTLDPNSVFSPHLGDTGDASSVGLKRQAPSRRGAGELRPGAGAGELRQGLA